MQRTSLLLFAPLLATSGCFEPNPAPVPSADTDTASAAGTDSASASAGSASEAGTQTETGPNDSPAPDDDDSGTEGGSESEGSSESVGSSETEGGSDTEGDTEPGDTCGDGVVDDGEACDDGVNDGSYGGCAAGCAALGPFCGDGEADAGDEGCDDGNDVDGDGCNNDCSASGQILWTETMSDGGSLLPRDIAVDADGDVLVLGYGYSTPTWLRRYDADGNFVDEGTPDAPTAHLAGLPNGDIAVCGGESRVGAYAGVLTPIMDEDWWSLVIPSNDDANAFCWGVAATPTGGLITAGAFSGQDYNGYAFVRAYDDAGGLDWSVNYSPGGLSVMERATSVAVADDGTVAIAGVVDTDPGQYDVDYHAWLRVYNANGSLQWSNVYGEFSPAHPEFDDVAIDPDGNVVTVGTENGFDLLIRRYDEGGGGVETSILEDSVASGGTPRVLVDGNDHIIVATSESAADIGESTNVRFRALNTDLDVLWEDAFNGDDDGPDTVDSIALDPADNSFVAFGRGGGADLWVRKYSQ